MGRRASPTLHWEDMLASSGSEEVAMGSANGLKPAMMRAVHDIHLLAYVDELKPGDHLPAERALAERLQVSRSTVRLALEHMRERGEIVTRSGRAGTVIVQDIATLASPARVRVNAKSARIIDRAAGSTAGLPHMLASQGMECVTTVLDARVQHCSERVCQAFHVPTSQQLVRVERLRTVDGQPLSYEQTYVDLRAYPDFLEFNLTQSIYQMLQFNYGTTIQSVEETIEVIPGFGRSARQLQLATGTPLLCAFSRALDGLGRVVVVSDDVYPATQVRLTTSHTLR